MLLILMLIMAPCLRAAYACTEDDGINEVKLSQPYQEYDSSGFHHYITHENITVNTTIVCSNVYSVGQIAYQYTDRNYDQFLTITESNISTLHVMELFKFDTILTLNLSHIHIKTIQPGAFTGLRKLKKLYLNDNALTQVSNGVYNSLHHLKILNLTNNQIHQIENGAFIGLAALTHFHVKNNNLVKFDDNFFDTLTHLTEVDVSYNPIEEFPFGRLRSIDVLIVAGTRLTKIEDDLSNLTVRVFDVSFSELSEIDFARFPRADEIYLANNNISAVSNCQKLDTLTLDISNNDIGALDGDFKSVSRLVFSHNNLHSFNKSAFGDLNSILVLDFGYNYLSKFPKYFFHKLKSLQILKLAHNGIKIVDTTLFQDLSSLTTLDLSQNLLEELQFGVFDNLNNLLVLNISGNRLKDLHQYTFNSLSNLLSLSFDDNQISSFDVRDLRKHLRNLEAISLDHNPWDCKELAKIEILLNDEGVNVIPGRSHDVENFRGIACQKSEELTIGNKSVILTDLATIRARNSKIGEIFNQDFEKSKFVQYFDKGYSQSNFFKYFDNFKLTLTKREESNGSKTEKLTAVQRGPEAGDGKILIFGVINQVFILIVLIAILYLIGFRRNNRNNSTSSSHMELC